MGYYTDYEVVALDGRADWKHALAKIMGYDEPSDLIGIKWYEHDDDMKTLSLVFPDVTFQLTGYGEETGDIWRAYYRNGVIQHAETTISFSACTLT